MTDQKFILLRNNRNYFHISQSKLGLEDFGRIRLIYRLHQMREFPSILDVIYCILWETWWSNS
jgi:hypothetical protein